MACAREGRPELQPLRQGWRRRAASRWGRAVAAAAPFLALLLVAGCATLPPVQAPRAEGWYGVLPPDGQAYLSLAVAANRGFVTQLLSESGAARGPFQEVIDRTDRVVWCVGAGSLAGMQGGERTLPAAQAPFSAVATGSYPKGLVDWRLGMSAQWKRVTHAASAGGVPAGWWWWQNRSEELQLVLPSRSVALFSNGDMNGMIARLTGAPSHAVPPPVRERLDASDFALSLPHPENLLAASLPFIRSVPVEGFVVSTDRPADEKASSDWAISGYLMMRSPRDARVFAVALKLLIASQGFGADAFGGIPLPLENARVAVSESTIEIRDMRVARDRIGELFAGFVKRMGLAGVTS